MTIKSRKESIRDLFDSEKPIKHLLKRQMHQRKDYVVDEEKNLSDVQRMIEWLNQRGRNFNDDDPFSLICDEFEEDLFEEITKIKEKGNVDESVISLMYRPATQKGFILSKEIFEISDKETGNIIATVEDLEIFTIERKQKIELYVQGRIKQHNDGAKSNPSKIFKGNKIKIRKIFPKGS